MRATLALLVDSERVSSIEPVTELSGLVMRSLTIKKYKKKSRGNNLLPELPNTYSSTDRVLLYNFEVDKNSVTHSIGESEFKTTLTELTTLLNEGLLSEVIAKVNSTTHLIIGNPESVSKLLVEQLTRLYSVIGDGHFTQLNSLTASNGYIVTTFCSTFNVTVLNYVEVFSNSRINSPDLVIDRLRLNNCYLSTVNVKNLDSCEWDRGFPDFEYSKHGKIRLPPTKLKDLAALPIIDLRTLKSRPLTSIVVPSGDTSTSLVVTFTATFNSTNHRRVSSCSLM